MLCQRCHKNLATVRYAEVVDGRVANLHLCQECLSKQQEEGAPGFEISGKAPTPKGILTPTEQPQKPEKTAGRRVCPSCGMKLSDTLSRDVVGCAQCYEVFAGALEARLREIHVALRYRGKARRQDNARGRLHAELQTKRALLRTALKLENYEEAAALRDQIKELEAGLTAVAQEHDAGTRAASVAGSGQQPRGGAHG